MGGESDPKVVSYSTLTKEQKPVSKKVSGILQQKLGKELEGYEGELTAELSPELLLAREFLKGYEPTRYLPGQERALGELLSGRPSYDIDKDAIDTFIRESVAKPLYMEYEREISPRIREAFAGAGGTFSSRSAEAQARALGDIGQAIAAERGKAGWQAQVLRAQLSEAAKQRQMQAIPLASQLASLPAAGAAMSAEIGGVFQSYEQQALDRAYNEWLRRRAEYSPYMGYALQYLGQPHMALQQIPGSAGIGSSIGAGLGAIAGGLIGSVGGPAGALAGAGIGTTAGAQIGGIF